MIILKKKLAGASRAGLLRFLARAKRSAGLRGEVNVLVAGSREIRNLNRRYRSKDQPTDVLSFPAEGGAGKDFAGDIAISADEAARSARQFGHSSADELKILMLHGVLHLAGYDHERDNGRMAQLEEYLRAQLGLPTALIARSRNGARLRHLRRKGQSR
ncbi:MAG: rRNA maturation RNase YbeY [Chlamydiota bacterium]